MTVVFASPAFWAPVTLNLPGDDGKPVTLKFRARYRRLKTSERRLLDRRARNNSLDMDKRQALRGALDNNIIELTAREREEIEADLACTYLADAEVLRLVLVDWDVKSASGEFVAYSPAQLEQACEELDGLEAALVVGYFAARRVAESAQELEKNSDGPSATSTDQPAQTS